MNLIYALLLTLVALVTSLVALRKLDPYDTRLEPGPYAIAATFFTFFPTFVFFGCLLHI
jgi:hypothetical protein